MSGGLDVLSAISQGLSSAGIPCMLTGSVALGYHGTPRMPHDLDFVVKLREAHVGQLMSAFAHDFHLGADEVHAALDSRPGSQGMVNLMHLASGMKVDLIMRHDADQDADAHAQYRQAEFARRQPVSLGSVLTWIVSREDLILSKLHSCVGAAREAGSGSERQEQDAAGLLKGSVDWDYLRTWAPQLGVAECLEAVPERIPYDTSPKVAEMVRKRYEQMTPTERVLIVMSMYQTARKIVASSLPPGLTDEERRLAIARRFYEGELPEKALLAHARWPRR